MENLVTCDLILDWLRECVEQKKMIDAHTWVDSAQKLNILISDEHDKLFELQQKVSDFKLNFITNGKSVAMAKIAVETTDMFKNMQKQKAKIEKIEEMIRIAKLQARLKDNEHRNY